MPQKNAYECSGCSAKWTDIREHVPDYRCPDCGTPCEPVKSVPAVEAYHTYRVYKYYVGCHVFLVSAESHEKACDLAITYGGDTGEVTFLHEANDPKENLFFTEVFETDNGGYPKQEDPVYVWNPEAAKLWREM